MYTGRIARVLIGGLLALVSVTVVSAAAPTRETQDFSGVFVIPGTVSGCGFDITVTQTGTGYITSYYDQAGNLVRVLMRSPRLQLAFTANGHTYTSISPAAVHIDVVNNTATFTGLQGRIIIPKQGLVGAATGKVVLSGDFTEVLSQHGQASLVLGLLPFAPEVCAALAP